MGVVAAIAAVTAVVGTGLSVASQRAAARKQRRLAQIRNRREQISQIRQARQLRGRALNVAAQTGAAGGSATAGAVGSVSSQLGGNLSFLDQSLNLQLGINRSLSNAATFGAAAGYNFIWGVYAVADPQWLFRFSGMPLMEHPQIFACLGMVIGLYGVLYCEVALRPEGGFVLAAVGPLGKVLGPIGLVGLIATGAWPLETMVLALTNDFVW